MNRVGQRRCAEEQRQERETCLPQKRPAPETPSFWGPQRPDSEIVDRKKDFTLEPQELGRVHHLPGFAKMAWSMMENFIEDTNQIVTLSGMGFPFGRVEYDDFVPPMSDFVAIRRGIENPTYPNPVIFIPPETPEGQDGMFDSGERMRNKGICSEAFRQSK